MMRREDDKMKRTAMNPTDTPWIAPEEMEPQTRTGVAPTAAVGLAPSLAVALDPIAPTPARDTALRGRLMARVARSAAANQAFVTTRRQDGNWQTLQAGIQQRLLHADEAAQTYVLQWADEAELDLPSQGLTHECLVLTGELTVGEGADASTLRAHDYLIHASGPLRLRAKAGTSLYWRRIRSDVDAYGQAVASHLAQADQLAWEPLRQGVEIKPLYAEGERVSMFVRFEPGATVPAHSHGHGEECLMVEGDLFLGDVLLCEGDFQFAPRDTGHHEGLHSDVGCLLYFHGAIDPVVIDPAVRPAA
jgi:quercetin dioxygenase-like cupin family protein